MSKRKMAIAGGALAAVITGGALTGAALPAIAESGQVDAATVSESPSATIERADTPAGVDDSTAVEGAGIGS